MKPIFAAFARNIVFANILLGFFLIGGYLGATNMVRELFPEFSLDIITIAVPWPGADPEEVEEGIVRKIEEAIDGVEGIKQYDSASGENRAAVVVEVKENYEVFDVKERIRNKVDTVVDQLPEEAEEPIIEELTLRTEVCLVALSGEGLSERKLKEWAEEVKDDLTALPGISQVQIFGARDYEIAIEISEEKLQEYGLSLGEVAALVRASNLNLSGGTVRTQGEEIRLRTMGRKYTGEELAEIVIKSSPDGDVIKLGRIAEIHDAFTEDPIISQFDGQPAITVSVLKTAEEDAIDISEKVNAYAAELQARLPEGMNIDVWSDTSDPIQARIALLTKNGLFGLILVFGLLWIFLDARLSFWAGMGMPISIAGALLVMWAIGATLNMISLFSLIMVLGIIVDDAIIVGESIYVHRKRGAPPLKAAVEGVNEVGLPVIAAVTTTMIAFMPLAFISGIMGKFIAILPVVVVACLAVSLIECLILLPAHLSHLPDPNHKPERGHPIANFSQRFHKATTGGLEWFVDHVFTPFLARVLEWRYVAVGAAIAIFMATMGLVGGGIVKFETFPNVDGDVLTATVEFPDGTPIEITERAVKQMSEAIYALGDRLETKSGEPMVKHVFSLTGSTISDEQPERGNHLGSVRVELLGTEFRGIHSNRIMAEWNEEIGLLPGATALSIIGMEAGPPGAPIEVWMQGEDLEMLTSAADKLVEELNTYEGVYQVQSDFRPGKNEMRFSLKPEARTLGLTTADLANQVYAGFFGEEAVRVQRGREDVRIRVRYPEQEREDITTLEDVRIRTPQGNEVPLLSVADVTYSPGYSTINRTDGLRRVAVTAEVSDTANADEIYADLEPFFAQLQADYPRMLLSVQGDKRTQRETFGPLAVTGPLAMLGMFIIIATIFRSYVQPLLILLAVPFGIVGAILGHLLLGFNLSIMSVFGMVALAGVVVNDAIVLIEHINDLVARGTPFFEALRRGGARRFRPIFLTTMTTCGGLAPLIMETDMQAQFLIPMAISIAGGVAFATLITLVFLPCLLGILNDLRRVAVWLRKREWPTPESVEPATDRFKDRWEDQPQSPAPGAAPGLTSAPEPS